MAIAGVGIFSIDILNLICFSLFSLDEKLSRLEDENHVLRQKTLTVTPKSNRSSLVKAFSEVSCIFESQCICLFSDIAHEQLVDCLVLNARAVFSFCSFKHCLGYGLPQGLLTCTFNHY